jgi:hypothetical protein
MNSQHITDVRDTITTIRRARESWTGCNWTHEHECAPSCTADHPDDDTVWCAGSSADCAYCARAGSDARAAAEEADAAIRALEGGRVAEALRHIREAAKIESGWGEVVSYGDAVDAVEEFIEESIAAATRYIAIARQDVGTCAALGWAALSIAPMVLAAGDDEDEVREQAEARAGHGDIVIREVR